MNLCETTSSLSGGVVAAGSMVSNSLGLRNLMENGIANMRASTKIANLEKKAAAAAQAKIGEHSENHERLKAAHWLRRGGAGSD